MEAVMDSFNIRCIVCYTYVESLCDDVDVLEDHELYHLGN